MDTANEYPSGLKNRDYQMDGQLGVTGKKEITYCVLKGRVRYMDREEYGHRTCCKKGPDHSSRIGMNLLDYCRLA